MYVCMYVCTYVDEYVERVSSSLDHAIYEDVASVHVLRSSLPCNKNTVLSLNRSSSNSTSPQHTSNSRPELITCTYHRNSSFHPPPTIVAITPTHRRYTQKVDLVSLCHTIMHVHNLLWIVVEDSSYKSSRVSRILQRCNVDSVHLNMATSKATKKALQKGVEQRNAGLDWARKYCMENCGRNCSGVVYFMDDDNKYDLRLFEEVSPTYILFEEVSPTYILFEEVSPTYILFEEVSPTYLSLRR